MQIGSGQFGTVYKGLLDEHDHRIPECVCLVVCHLLCGVAPVAWCFLLFLASHVAGSLSLSLSTPFSTCLLWLLPFGCQLRLRLALRTVSTIKPHKHVYFIQFETERSSNSHHGFSLDQHTTRALHVVRYTVAVKTVVANEATGTASADATSDLLDEAIVMSRVGRHNNVCMLIGVVTSGMPWMLVCS